MLLGSNVADTIKSGIAKLPTFAGTPGTLIFLLILKCICVIVAVIWTEAIFMYTMPVTLACRLAHGGNAGRLIDDWIVVSAGYLPRASSVHIPLRWSECFLLL